MRRRMRVASRPPPLPPHKGEGAVGRISSPDFANCASLVVNALAFYNVRCGACMTDWKAQQVLIVGGGIGGLAAALALARKGIPSQVIEQAPEFKEIGAGIQLGPNVFWMFEALGLIEPISALAVFPNNLIMMDSVTGQEVTRIPLGDTFRKKFHHPYALIHRADLHKVLLEACQKSDLIRLDASQKVVKVDEAADGITVRHRERQGVSRRGADRRRRLVVDHPADGGRRRQAQCRRPYHLSRRAADVGNAGAISLARHGAVGRREGASGALSAAHRRIVQSRRRVPFQPLRGGLGQLRRSGRAARAFCENLRAGAHAAQQDRELAHVGVVRPAADQGLEPRPHHAGRRRRPSDAAISGARRRHVDRGRGVPRRKGRRDERRLPGRVSRLPAGALSAHRPRANHGARLWRVLSCRRRRQGTAQHDARLAHARRCHGRHGVALWQAA